MNEVPLTQRIEVGLFGHHQEAAKPINPRAEPVLEIEPFRMDEFLCEFLDQPVVLRERSTDETLDKNVIERGLKRARDLGIRFRGQLPAQHRIQRVDEEPKPIAPLTATVNAKADKKPEKRSKPARKPVKTKAKK